ncbi:MAG: ferrous iron transporter B [Firmicutes bacterium]|nr:ferrous iron transporter B [Bacillota bacterium]
MKTFGAAPGDGAHGSSVPGGIPPHPVLALVGCPNSGKSALFNALAGSGYYAQVSNYPGTTVEVARAGLGPWVLYDCPGIYLFPPASSDEEVTLDLLGRADLVVNVVNALCLQRDLALTYQLKGLGFRLVVVLNMVDEAGARGLEVDWRVLSRLLGVPVVPTVAVSGRGVGRLRKLLLEWGSGVEQGALRGRTRARAVPLPNHSSIPKRPSPATALSPPVPPTPAELTQLLSRCTSVRRGYDRRGISLAAMTVRPLTGYPILLGALAGVYYLLGNLIAHRVVGFTEDVLFKDWWEPAVRMGVGRLTPLESPLGWILAGEFGILTTAVTYLFGLLLPLVVGFSLVLAFLEDVGYLPRIAVLLDEALSTVGLNGRAVIPLILGFGCVTMATMTTRILATEREKRIATFLLALGVPCSAQLAVIAVLFASMGPAVALWYAVIMFVVFGIVGSGIDAMLPGRSQALLMELPPLRIPHPGNVLMKAAMRTRWFMAEAGPLFALGLLGLGLLRMLGVLGVLEGALTPLVTGWLGLPPGAAPAFLMGFLRRDFGAAGLYSLNLEPLQAVVAAVVITLFVPCIASAVTIVRERGFLEGAAVWIGCLSISVLVGGLLSRLLAPFF